MMSQSSPFSRACRVAVGSSRISSRMSPRRARTISTTLRSGHVEPVDRLGQIDADAGEPCVQQPAGPAVQLRPADQSGARRLVAQENVLRGGQGGGPGCPPG